MSAGNLFADLPATQEAAERLETLLDRPGLRIERIVSTGQASPPGFWYQQADAEWVVLLAGEALLRFAFIFEAQQGAPLRRDSTMPMLGANSPLPLVRTSRR